MFETEKTSAGDQALVPSVKPVTDKTRLELKARASLKPSRPQRDCDHGLFGDDKNQTALLDFV